MVRAYRFYSRCMYDIDAISCSARRSWRQDWCAHICHIPDVCIPYMCAPMYVPTYVSKRPLGSRRWRCLHKPFNKKTLKAGLGLTRAYMSYFRCMYNMCWRMRSSPYVLPPPAVSVAVFSGVCRLYVWVCICVCVYATAPSSHYTGAGAHPRRDQDALHPLRQA